MVVLGAYGAGRFMAPTKVEDRERIVERLVVDEKVVEARIAAAKVTWEKDIQDHTRVETRYVEGKPVVRIEYRDRDTHSEGAKVETKIEYVDREKIVYQDRVVEKERIVERDCPRLTLLGKGGIVIDSLKPTWGAAGNYRIPGLGPVVGGLDYTRQDNILLFTAGITF